MLSSSVKMPNDEKINKELLDLSVAIDLAIKSVDFKMLNKLEKRWKEIRKNYSNYIINNEQLIDQTIIIYRKFDIAKRELVKFRKQQKREEVDNSFKR